MKVVHTLLKIVAWIWMVLSIIGNVGLLMVPNNPKSVLIIVGIIELVPAILYLRWRSKVEKPIKENKRIEKENKRVEIETKRAEKEQAEEIKRTSYIEDDGKMIFSFKGIMNDSPCTATIDGNWLVIERAGVFNAFKHGLDGKKKINIKNITAVQFKEGGFTSGYIQLVLMGSQEVKGGVNDAHWDENSIVFGPDYNEAARKLVTILEDKIDQLQNTNNRGPVIVQGESVAKQLKDLKELLDSGVLTQEEFNMQKEKVLAN